LAVAASTIPFVDVAADWSELKVDALARIAQVFDGGPAQQAGLSAGDVLAALDDLRVTPARLDALLARYSPGDTVQVLAFRRDELQRFELGLARQPPPRRRSCFLVLGRCRPPPPACAFACGNRLQMSPWSSSPKVG